MTENDSMLPRSVVPLPTRIPWRPSMPPTSSRRRWTLGGVLLLLVVFVAQGCVSERYARPRPGMTQRGIASWYGPDFHGKRTASGEVYDMEAMTAAHKELPLGTVVHVRNLENGREVTVRVNDRGPFVRGRILDLSRAGARAIGMLGPGTAKIELRVMKVGGGRAGPSRFSRYTLQVGAYQERANAEAMVQRLRAAGEKDVRIEVDGKWNRVRLGRFRERDEAENIQRRLGKRGFSATIVGIH